MRVIAGEFRSRRLKSIPGDATRPTPDRLRETLFDILAARVPGAVFLDAYAGTGAVGIEALSRGARHAIFLEKDRAAIETIRDNLAMLQVERRATVVKGAVLLTLGRRLSFSIRLTAWSASTKLRWNCWGRRRRRSLWCSIRYGWRWRKRTAICGARAWSNRAITR